jgi:MtN3 and saliva related transmembrane protein
MDRVTLLGMSAGILTTFSLMPQVMRMWKTKSARDISLVTYIIFSIGISLWILYGAVIRSAPVILANTATLFLALAILFFKLRFK